MGHYYGYEKILVIDDEKMILGVVESALLRFGFNVETASDGKEGIKKFDRDHFDAVITDICMPCIDGNDVARHVRISDRQNTPVIDISGTPWLTDDCDFDMILGKSLSKKHLVDSIVSIIADSAKGTLLTKMTYYRELAE